MCSMCVYACTCTCRGRKGGKEGGRGDGGKEGGREESTSLTYTCTIKSLLLSNPTFSEKHSEP